MTLERAKALKPGEKLTWVGRNQRFSATGATAWQMWSKKHGEVVEFISFSGDNDNYRFPIIIVKTRSGESSFSSGWFV